MHSTAAFDKKFFLLIAIFEFSNFLFSFGSGSAPITGYILEKLKKW